MSQKSEIMKDYKINPLHIKLVFNICVISILDEKRKKVTKKVLWRRNNDLKLPKFDKSQKYSIRIKNRKIMLRYVIVNSRRTKKNLWSSCRKTMHFLWEMVGRSGCFSSETTKVSIRKKGNLVLLCSSTSTLCWVHLFCSYCCWHRINVFRSTEDEITLESPGPLVGDCAYWDLQLHGLRISRFFAPVVWGNCCCYWTALTFVSKSNKSSSSVYSIGSVSLRYSPASV